MTSTLKRRPCPRCGLTVRTRDYGAMDPRPRDHGQTELHVCPHQIGCRQIEVAGELMPALRCKRCEQSARARALLHPEWAAMVTAAIRAAGSITGAAEALGVSRDTLERWVAEVPRLVDGVELRGRGRPRATE